jgi:hypothetical protein
MNFRDDSFLKDIYSFVELNNLEKAITACESKLTVLPMTPFHKVVGRELLKSRRNLANWLINFSLEATSKLKKVEAIYCEMNGFSINPNQWYITGIGFRYLQDYQNGSWEKVYNRYDNEFTITGFEDLQDVFAFAYANKSFRDQHEDAKYYCEYAIVLRLQQLFESAYQELKNYEVGRIPIFVTAHDYDLIYKAVKKKNVA